MARLKDKTDEEIKKLFTNFLNKLIKSLRVKDIDNDELKFMYDELYKKYRDSNMFEYKLTETYHEIISNYKRYLPFCYASIITALKKVYE